MDYGQLEGCCGAYEIHGFDMDEYENRTEAKEDLIVSISRVPAGKLMLITLTDGQLKEGWLSIIQECGFKRVGRWINSNHGNVCNLFIKERDCKPAPRYTGKGKGK